MTEEVPSWVWVGLSNCDEYRDRRTKFARETLEKLTDYQVMMVDGGQLFHEACCCYQNSAFMAAAVMCRAAVEAAVYTVVTRKMVVGGLMWSNAIDLGLVQDEKGKIARWGSILQVAKDQGFVDTNMETTINHIRERGNLAVHLGQKQDKDMRSWQEGKTATPGNRWIFENEIRTVIEETLSLLNSLISKHATKS